MTDHRQRFLVLSLRAEALRFGAFTLKSGRVSPYFFNAGRFDSGAALAALAACYADAVDAAGVDFDLLFGPAYKGIPLATALACEYARRGRDLPLAYN
ncbi:MAG: orotate phosphoribosyltransferase, partial [Pseudomonadota bacterium]|nr:orotate phosphoribosyltransferase [Pseudomonadota bacterium]